MDKLFSLFLTSKQFDVIHDALVAYEESLSAYANSHYQDEASMAFDIIEKMHHQLKDQL
jgi:hypothetical protein